MTDAGPARGPAAALLESDRRYFELGASLDSDTIGGAQVAWMPGLQATAAGCVVQRVRPEVVGGARAWVDDVDRRVMELGYALARVYLDGPSPVLEGALAAAGYRRRVEIGYLVEGPLPPAPAAASRADVVLREVVDGGGWEVKRKLHAGSDVAADGHATAAEDWVELERRKCDTGGMRAFLVEVDGEACGGVATLEGEGLLRAKNLFVQSDRRREGIAAQTIRLLSGRAGELGLAATGIFGVDGRPGNAVYVHLRMTPVVRQVEWSKPLCIGPLGTGSLGSGSLGTGPGRA